MYLFVSTFLTVRLQQLAEAMQNTLHMVIILFIYKNMNNTELQLQQLQQENPDKIYEIFEGVVREVLPDEAEVFWVDPIGADPLLQRKYIGVEYADYVEPESSAPEDFDTERFRVSEYVFVNPYTKSEKVVRFLEEIPKPTTQEVVEGILADDSATIPEHIELENALIGEIIKQKIYDGNINAELAELTKGLIKTLAVLVGIVGKAQINQIYAEEIAQARRVSAVRVQCGLEPFDLSFLD